MGYKGETNIQKTSFKYLLKSNFEEDDYKILKNTPYTKYLEECSEEFKEWNIPFFKSNFPEPVTGASARSKTHLIVMPDAFRSLCMMINTEKGKQIRKYYITLEKLIKAYNFYQSIYRCQEAERAMGYKGNKIDELILKLDDASAKADADRVNADAERVKAEAYRVNADAERVKTEARFQKLLGVAEDTKDTIDHISCSVVNDTYVDSNKQNLLIIYDTQNENCIKRFKVYRVHSLSFNKNSIPNSWTRLVKLKIPNATIFWDSVCKYCKQIMDDDTYLEKYKNSQYYGSHTITPDELKKVVSKMKKLWKTHLKNNGIDVQFTL
jgi:phage anti-repressor protein